MAGTAKPCSRQIRSTWGRIAEFAMCLQFHVGAIVRTFPIAV